jgi:uncharacterized protein
LLAPDVNVLIYAHRVDSSADHAAYADWLKSLVAGPEPFALSVLVLSGLVRVVTRAKTFKPPSTHDQVFGFIDELAARPNARVIGPGPDHLRIFTDLCRRSGATGKLVADAQHAAVAIEHGCTLVTTDSDFDRFPGLRWLHPLKS